MFFAKEKIFLNKKYINRFIDYYAKSDNWHKFDKREGDLGFGWTHYSLIRMIKPKRVLCIGSKWGFIPAVCALACKHNGFGVVDFVDAGYDIKDYSGPGEHWGGVGFWKKCNAKKYFSKFGLSEFIKLHVMTSENYKKMYPKRNYGYIYVDGDHSYKGVLLDYKMFWPRLLRGGFMGFHDINSPDMDGNIYGTRQFWSEIKLEQNHIEFIENPGLGILKKNSS